MTLRPSRRSPIRVAALVLAALLLVPPTVASGEDTEWLDEELARVGDVVLTRRVVWQEDVDHHADDDPARFEPRIQQALRERVRLLLFADAAARTEGIVILDELVEEVADHELELTCRRAEETEGKVVSAETWLARRGTTLERYRRRVSQTMHTRALSMHLEGGLTVDAMQKVADALPREELRRFYDAHPQLHEAPAEARAAYFLFRIERLAQGDVAYLEAEEKCQAAAEALRRSFEGGAPPEVLARRFLLPEGDWNADAADAFRSPSAVEGTEAHAVEAWVFAAERKAREAKVFDAPDGPAVIGVLETRPGRRVPFEEAVDGLLARVRELRRDQLLEAYLLEILDGEGVVQPPTLATALRADARETLATIARDPAYELVRKVR